MRNKIDRVLRGRFLVRALERVLLQRSFGRIRRSAFLQLVAGKLHSKEARSSDQGVTLTPPLTEKSRLGRLARGVKTEKTRMSQYESLKEAYAGIRLFQPSARASEDGGPNYLSLEPQRRSGKDSFAQADGRPPKAGQGEPFWNGDWNIPEPGDDALLPKLARNCSQREVPAVVPDATMFQTQPALRCRKASPTHESYHFRASEGHLGGLVSPQMITQIPSSDALRSWNTDWDRISESEEPVVSPLKLHSLGTNSGHPFSDLSIPKPCAPAEEAEPRHSKNQSTRSESSECILDSVDDIQRRIDSLPFEVSVANEHLIGVLAKKLQEIRSIFHTKQKTALQQVISLRAIVDQLESGVADSMASEPEVRRKVFPEPTPDHLRDSNDFSRKENDAPSNRRTGVFGCESQMSVQMPLKHCHSRQSLFVSARKHFDSQRQSQNGSVNTEEMPTLHNKGTDKSRRWEVEFLNFSVLLNMIIRKHRRRQVRQALSFVCEVTQIVRSHDTLRSLADKLRRRECRRDFTTFADRIRRNGVVLRRLVSHMAIDYGRLLRLVLRRLSSKASDSSFFSRRYFGESPKNSPDTPLWGTAFSEKTPRRHSLFLHLNGRFVDVMDVLRLSPEKSGSDQASPGIAPADLCSLYQRLEAEYDSQL